VYSHPPTPPRGAIDGGVYARLINSLSATRAGSWLVRHLASRLDPWLFGVSDGRFTITGRPTLPMLSLTTIGRNSGQLRTVQLAFQRDGDSYLVVASAMGQARHPAWRYNLEAAGRATIRLRGQVVDVTATILSDEEKQVVWDTIKQTIPQMKTYEQRTDRNIKVFRLVAAT
jgi:deazaflavin-dependent oxidoreductase (nitroreductase family)